MLGMRTACKHVFWCSHCQFQVAQTTPPSWQSSIELPASPELPSTSSNAPRAGPEKG